MWWSKKIVLNDILSDMIDIHSHLLCGVDDGAKNIEQTKNIIYKLKEYGINQSFATPHIMSHIYNNSPESLSNVFHSTLLPLAKELNFEVRLAAEYMLDDNFRNHLNSQTPLLTFDGEHLLIEMSTMAPTLNLSNLIFDIQCAGYIPILAHPERYLYMSKDDILKLKSQGVLFQMNLFSLANAYGRDVAENAYSLLDRSIPDFIGTDVHKASMLEKIKSQRITKKQSSQLQRLINNNYKLWKEPHKT